MLKICGACGRHHKGLCPHCAQPSSVPSSAALLLSLVLSCSEDSDSGKDSASTTPVPLYGVSYTVDADGDGFLSEDSGGDDCDDTDPDVHPGADDPAGDGVDADCDGADG